MQEFKENREKLVAAINNLERLLEIDAFSEEAYEARDNLLFMLSKAEYFSEVPQQEMLKQIYIIYEEDARSEYSDAALSKILSILNEHYSYPVDSIGQKINTTFTPNPSEIAERTDFSEKMWGTKDKENKVSLLEISPAFLLGMATRLNSNKISHGGKYLPFNWKKSNPTEILEAFQRHSLDIHSYMVDGKPVLSTESLNEHLLAAAINLMFLYEITNSSDYEPSRTT